MSVTVGRAVNDIAAGLTAAGIENARLDARLLVAHVMDFEPADAFSRADLPIDPVQAEALAALSARRRAHEPISRILGYREFWGLRFDLNADTLDPRPDTETVVEAAIDLKMHLPKEGPRILDLGTGTGCILIALLKEWPQATGVGVDCSANAIGAAASNARRHGVHDRVEFRVGDWCNGLDAPFDLIVSNPPYVAVAEMRGLALEVSRFDPAVALLGGQDGLEAYRTLVPQTCRILKKGGWIALEVGLGQDQPVSGLLAKTGFEVVNIRHDLGGIPRCIVGQRK